MKKVSIFLSFFMLSFFSAVQAGEVKGILGFFGCYALNLGVVRYKTGSINMSDLTVSYFSALLKNHYLMFPPKTEKECKINMGMQVAAVGLMLGRMLYKTRHRPMPVPIARPGRA